MVLVCYQLSAELDFPSPSRPLRLAGSKTPFLGRFQPSRQTNGKTKKVESTNGLNWRFWLIGRASAFNSTSGRFRSILFPYILDCSNGRLSELVPDGQSFGAPSDDSWILASKCSTSRGSLGS